MVPIREGIFTLLHGVIPENWPRLVEDPEFREDSWAETSDDRGAPLSPAVASVA